MAIEPKLVRRVEGTIASPAGLQNKQFKFDVGDDGAGGDQTRMIYKDSGTIEHEFWTVEEAKAYIANYGATITGAGGSSPFILVSNIADYKEACELTLPFNIWCDDQSGLGGILVGSGVSNEWITINPVSSKTIYGTGGIIFRLEPIDILTLEYALPATGEAININHCGIVTDSVDSVGSAVVSVYGGAISGPAHILRFTEFKKNVINSYLFNDASENDVIIYYEKHLQTNTASAGVLPLLWSGLNDRIWLTTNYCATIADGNKLVESTTGFYKSNVIESVLGATTATYSHKRSKEWGGVEYAVDYTYRAVDDDMNSEYTATYIKQLKNSSGTLANSLQLNGDGQLAIGATGIAPWGKQFNVVQINDKIAMCCDTSVETTVEPTIAYNCYCDKNGFWRFSYNYINARIEEELFGTKRKYISTNSPVADDVITWVSVSDYIRVYYLASTPSTVGTITAFNTTLTAQGYYELTLTLDYSLSGIAGSEGFLFHIKEGANILAYPAFSKITAEQMDTSFTYSFKKFFSSSELNTISVYLSSVTNCSFTEVRFSVERCGEKITA
jgi:hypothetical protein